MFKYLSIILIVGLIASCGKKEQGASGETVIPQPQMPEREEFLESQQILCESGTYCPDYIAKIVVFDKGTPRFCTGTMVSKSQILTSASCLPSYLRNTDADCSKDVFLFFNKGSRPPERVGCKSIIQISTLDGNKAEYWRDDVAILQMDRNLNWRDFRDVNRNGFSDGSKMRFFAVDQSNNFTGIIRKEECEVVLGSYLYPLSSNESSPNILLSGCTKKNGYRGAAILDNFPRIRGVLSDLSALRSSLENSSLLIKPLKDFVHVSNFACAPFFDETSVLNEVECSKNLDYGLLSSAREHLLSDQERFGDLIGKLERNADGLSKYLKITTKLTPVGDRHALDFLPMCFKNISSWLPGISTKSSFDYEAIFPARTLKKGVDSNGRAITQEVEEKQMKYYFGFSPKRLLKEKLSDVFLSTDATDTLRISALKACP